MQGALGLRMFVCWAQRDYKRLSKGDQGESQSNQFPNKSHTDEVDMGYARVSYLISQN